MTHRLLVLLVLSVLTVGPSTAVAQTQDVLVWGTGLSESGVDSVAAYIDALGSFNTVDGTAQTNQTLAQLTAYDIVLFFTDGSGGSDPNNGDVLADFADTGARLVICTFSWANQGGNTLAGRIVTDQISPFVVAGTTLYSNVTMASNDGSTYFTDVNSLEGYYHDNVALNPGAVQHGTWSDGQPLLASKNNVVAINLYPNAGPGQISGDYEELFTNALTAESCDDLDGDGVGGDVCGDCDDADPNNYPGNTELCDGLDNDCNGLSDADTAGEIDWDGDGSLSCVDCADNLPDVYPGAVEVCDGEDNNCDGTVDEGALDADSDGSVECLDCDDTDANNYPGNTELCDGQDNDCSGAPDFDAEGETDLDGDLLLTCEGDCDDDNPATQPGAEEICDGEDNDCDGEVPSDEVDLDTDGYSECGGDCDDDSAAISPDGIEEFLEGESCSDGLDNDCDGLIDDDEEDCLPTGDDDDDDDDAADDDDSAGDDDDDDDDTRQAGGACSCSAAPSEGSALPLGLLVLLGVVWRRRK